MQNRHKLVLLVLARIQAFLDSHSGVMRTLNQSELRAALDELVSGCESSAEAQVASACRKKKRLAERRARREELRRQHLRPIIALARSKDDENPYLGSLRMPGNDESDSSLRSTAHAIAMIVDQQKGAFLDAGFPDDFVEQLRNAVEALEAAAAEYERARMDGVHATLTLGALVPRASQLVRVLNALVIARIRRNKSLMAEWQRAISFKRSAAKVRAQAGPKAG